MSPVPLARCRLLAVSLSVVCLVLDLVSSSAARADDAAALRDRKLWAARYDGPEQASDFAHGVAVSPNGTSVFVTGGSYSSDSLNYATVAYDAVTGTPKWVARYDGPGNSDNASALAVSPEGSTVFVTGDSYGSGTINDYATVAYDAATGTQRWVARYDGPDSGPDYACALAVSRDGASVFVTGVSRSEMQDDFATVAYDAATGAQRWVARYDGPGADSDAARALVVSLDGSTVFVTGDSYGSGTINDYATVAYNTATGAQRWVVRYDGPGSGADFPKGAEISADGSTVFVTGYSLTSGTTDYDYATVAYDSVTGALRWVARYGGAAAWLDEALALAVSPTGSTVFVTGFSYGADTNDDYVTVAYDSVTGAQRWVARYGAPGYELDRAYALGVSANGSTVFVTGQRSGDYATVAYDAASGHPKNAARGTEGTAYDLAMSPDGAHLYITGAAGGSLSLDYGTVAYAAG